MRVAMNLCAVIVSACALSVACSQTPTSPTQLAATPAATAAIENGAAVSGAQGTSQTWQAFQARGWNCRTPNPTTTVCTPPNQPLPTIAIPPAQPPADRPEAVTLKRWLNGVFDANVLMVRPEIYNGRICESTGAPYNYIGVLGYYECAHTVGN